MGIELAGERLVAVHAEKIGEAWHVSQVMEDRLRFVTFRGVPHADAIAELAQALERVIGTPPRAQIPIQLALPDPAAMFQVLEFDALPGTTHERNALARFRLEKEWSAAAKLECVSQPLGDDKGRALLLVLAVDRIWLECVRSACRMARIVPHTMDMTVCHVFNRLQESMDLVSGGGALLVAEPHSWTLMLWDNVRRLRFVRTRWRGTENQPPDHETIAMEIERLIRAFVMAEPERNVSGLHICAADAEFAMFTACLDARMHTPSVRVKLGTGLSFAPEIEEWAISPGALAAAVLRT
jgi:hypothetical protein